MSASYFPSSSWYQITSSKKKTVHTTIGSIIASYQRKLDITTCWYCAGIPTKVLLNSEEREREGGGERREQLDEGRGGR